MPSCSWCRPTAGRADRVEEERPDLPTRLGDALALGLRLREGIDLDALTARLGIDVRQAIGGALDEMLEAACLEWHRRRLRIAEASILVTSEILVRIEGAIADWRDRADPESVGSDSQAGAQLADRAVLTRR